jgi:hypothetical protein
MGSVSGVTCSSYLSGSHSLNPVLEGSECYYQGGSQCEGNARRRLCWCQTSHAGENRDPVTGAFCPYAEGETFEVPPRFESWSESGQFEAAASNYDRNGDMHLLNNPNNPYSGILHFNNVPEGWFSFDAGAPTAMTQFSYMCDGLCPGFIIEYTDDVRRDWVSDRRSQQSAACLPAVMHVRPPLTICVARPTSVPAIGLLAELEQRRL